MKILIINKYFHPTIGGVESVVKSHALELSKDHQVTILCASDKPTKSTVIDYLENIKIIRAKTSMVKWSMPISFQLFYLIFVHTKKYDKIFLHEPFPIGTIFFYIFRSLSRKLIVYYHSDLVKQKLLIKPIEYAQRSYMCCADKVLTTSPNLVSNSNVLSKLGNDVDVVPIWLDDHDHNQLCVKSVYEPPCKPNFLFIGRNSYYKGIECLLQAFMQYKREGGIGSLTLIGDDFTMLSGASQASALKSVHFINRSVTEEEKEDFLRKCDCLVFPSIHKSEAFGIVQLEALRAGKPVINTQLPTGVPWVSKHLETGITVQPGSVGELMNAFFKLEDTELRKQMSTNASARFTQKFSKNKVTKSFRTASGI